ncbi:MAG: MBL fold metallo-hydrolase, partial [Ilumatobacteraceae bacterium]
MYLKQYYLGCLSHASYLIGDTASGVAAVVDPQRDVSQYLDDARTAGLSIDWVIETHFHADFLSGHLELADATGATIVFGRAAEGRTAFDIEAMADGDTIILGDSDDNVHLEILETPGHTPESISAVVRTTAGSPPHAGFTGDTLFIGDVGGAHLQTAGGDNAPRLARHR